MGEVAWLSGEEKDGTEEEGIFVAETGRASEVLADQKRFPTGNDGHKVV